MILAVRVKSRSFGIAFKETSRDGFQVEARHHSACETSFPESGEHTTTWLCSRHTIAVTWSLVVTSQK